MESRRTVETLALRESERFDRLGLRIQIQDAVPGAEQLRSLFHERARAYYQAVDVELVPHDGRNSSLQVAAAPKATAPTTFSVPGLRPPC